MESRKCLTPGCKRQAKTRGLCSVCYPAASRAIQTEKIIKNVKVTWDLLIRKGLALPSAKESGDYGKFMRALEDRIDS